MKSQNRTWLTIIVLFRVVITLAVMMALFWGMWIGYFTLPLILIGVFFVILAISDIGILVSLNGDETNFWKKFQTNHKRNDLDKTNEVPTDEERH